MSAELTDADAWAWWVRNAERQGRSPELDPAVIRKVAVLALTGSDDDPATVRQVGVLALASRPANGSTGQKGGAPS